MAREEARFLPSICLIKNLICKESAIPQPFRLLTTFALPSTSEYVVAT